MLELDLAVSVIESGGADIGVLRPETCGGRAENVERDDDAAENHHSCMIYEFEGRRFRAELKRRVEECARL